MSQARGPTFVELLRERARRQPERAAFVFLADGEVECGRMTYADLDRRARAVAARLRGRGAAGERVLLIHRDAADFLPAFFGCLYAGAAAVPTPAPHPALFKHALPRLHAIIGDAAPSFAIASPSLRADLEALLARAGTGPLRWIDGGENESGADAWREEASAPGELALLQYTSGSTASPRGVMITHGNLVENSRMMLSGSGGSDASVGVSWLPFIHDMGLGTGLLLPVYGGFPSVLMSPLSFLKKPSRWMSAVSRYRATFTAGPSFAYELCARKTSAEDLSGLDLSALRNAVDGADVVRAAVLDLFARRFAPCGFQPSAFFSCYGLAEATLFVTGVDAGSEPARLAVDRAALERGRAVPCAPGPSARVLVDCGRALPGTRLAIVDPETRAVLPERAVGEIWVSGPHVARGYWNRPEETRETFQAELADGGSGPSLRTGDLGFLDEGRLYVSGRLKDRIIVRGVNISPEDVEETAEGAHPLLRHNSCAAFGVEVDDEERLVVVAETAPEARREDAAAAAAAVRQAVFDALRIRPHDVVLIRRGVMPKTTSGKVRRAACRALYEKGELDPTGSA
jgi:acyl-CoA synthetase (AMP-forming)/AMP-acid ligase II